MPNINLSIVDYVEFLIKLSLSLDLDLVEYIRPMVDEINSLVTDIVEGINASLEEVFDEALSLQSNLENIDLQELLIYRQNLKTEMVKINTN